MENKLTNPNCFDQNGDQCVEVSVSSSDLGIDSGSSLAYTLHKMIEAISSLQAKVSSMGSVSTETDIGNLTITDSPMSTTSSVPFKLTVTPGNTSTDVQYDLRDVLFDSKQDVVYVEAYGNQNGITSRVFRGSSSVGSFNAKPENFPLSLTVEVTSLSSEGQKIIKFQKTVTNTKSTTDEYPTIIDLAKMSLTSQKDVNQVFDQKVGSLENKINQMDSISFNGSTGFNNIFSDLQSQIDNVQSTSSDTATTVDASVEALSSEIVKQQETIEAQTKVIEDLKSQLSTVRSAIGFSS